MQVTAITAEISNTHTHTHTHAHTLCHKIQCARTARAIQRNPVSKNKKQKTTTKKKQTKKPVIWT